MATKRDKALIPLRALHMGQDALRHNDWHEFADCANVKDLFFSYFDSRVLNPLLIHNSDQTFPANL